MALRENGHPEANGTTEKVCDERRHVSECTTPRNTTRSNDGGAKTSSVCTQTCSAAHTQPKRTEATASTKKTVTLYPKSAITSNAVALPTHNALSVPSTYYLVFTLHSAAKKLSTFKRNYFPSEWFACGAFAP